MPGTPTELLVISVQGSGRYGWHDPGAEWYYSGIPQHASGEDTRRLDHRVRDAKSFRAALDRLMRDACKGLCNFDVVIVWRLVPTRPSAVVSSHSVC